MTVLDLVDGLLQVDSPIGGKLKKVLSLKMRIFGPDGTILELKKIDALFEPEEDNKISVYSGKKPKPELKPVVQIYLS